MNEQLYQKALKRLEALIFVMDIGTVFNEYHWRELMQIQQEFEQAHNPQEK